MRSWLGSGRKRAPFPGCRRWVPAAVLPRPRFLGGRREPMLDDREGIPESRAWPRPCVRATLLPTRRVRGHRSMEPPCARSTPARRPLRRGPSWPASCRRCLPPVPSARTTSRQRRHRRAGPAGCRTRQPAGRGCGGAGPAAPCASPGAAIPDPRWRLARRHGGASGEPAAPHWSMKQGGRAAPVFLYWHASPTVRGLP